MVIQHENGLEVVAAVGMRVWVLELIKNRGGYVDEIVFFEPDVFGDPCMRLRGGDLVGPREVVAKWMIEEPAHAR